MSKNRVVVFTDNNAKILVNPSKEDLKDLPVNSYVINPDLSNIKNIDTHFWKRNQYNQIVSMTEEEKQERLKQHENLINSGVNKFDKIVLPPEVRIVEVIKEVPVEKVVEVEKIVEKIVEVSVIKEIEKPIAIVKEVIKEVVRDVPVEVVKVEEKIIETVKEIEKEIIKHSKLAWVLLAIESVGVITWILIK